MRTTPCLSSKHTHLGNIFHVDFGFILGRDPKPFPAAMKITKEMVEAMGGIDSVHYQSFLSYSFTAYNILRKSANLILNLFGLMVDANIPDIKTEPDKAVWKVGSKQKRIKKKAKGKNGEEGKNDEEKREKGASCCIRN